MANEIVKYQEKVSEITRTVVAQINVSNIRLPAHYNKDNALQSAFLKLQEVKDKDKRLALDVCTKDSVQRAFFSMVIQGLDPVKEQCHFIVRGRQLTLMRSYLGSIAVARRVESWLKEVRAVAVYEGDELQYDIVDGLKCNIKHVQSIQSTLNGNMVAAYALAIDQDNKVAMTEVMDLRQIHSAWRKSTRKVFLDSGQLNPESAHYQFPDRMARRTVINRLCKQIISTSSDELLLLEALKTDADITIHEEIKYNANQRRIDFDQPEGEPTAIEPPADDGKPVAIDFNDPASATETAAPVEMATKDDCRRIYDLNVQAGRKDKADVLGQVGGFIGHEIDGLSDLTKSEAASYIAAIEDELKSEPKPDWL